METIVYSANGQEIGKIGLPDFFNVDVSSVLLHEVTTAYLSNQRSGTHKVKTRGEVAFSGAKPWKQKGTGRARAGQRNSPLWRKGGIIFGPQPRDYFVKISKQKKKLSLSMALSLQFRKGNIIVVDALKVYEAKTKEVAKILKNLKIMNRKVVFTISNDMDFRLASRNIKDVVVESCKNVNAYQVLWANKLVITPEAISSIKERQSVV
jgi:large subunit ribosomal protein L4